MPLYVDGTAAAVVGVKSVCWPGRGIICGQFKKRCPGYYNGSRARRLGGAATTAQLKPLI